MVPVFVNHADKALNRFLKAEVATDLQDLSSKFTLDAATEFLFGQCVHSLEEDLPRPWNQPAQLVTPVASPSEKSGISLLPTTTDSVPRTATQAFPSAFTSALHTLAARLRSGALWPLLEITKDSTRRDVGIIRGFVRGIVQRALEKREERERLGEDATEGNTLLDHLVTVSDGKPATFVQNPTDHNADITLIQDELVNILIAGRDTTASAITFATYLLSQHPTVLTKLSTEVHSVLDTSELTLDSLRQMPYLRAIINETLRLFPSVPMNVRDSVAERVLTSSSGTRYYLPSGTGITYSLLHLHRSPKYWGPTASEFAPERFVSGTDGRYEAYYAKTPFVFMPFNAGPRSCLGQQLAYAEVGVFLCRLVQRLRAKHGAGNERVWLDEEAISPACRVPSSWAEEEEKKGLPMHARSLPARTESGVSPRRMIEKVWPKSHLTLFVDGGLWLRV